MIFLNQNIDNDLKEQIQAFIDENMEAPPSLLASFMGSIFDKVRRTATQDALEVPHKSKISKLLDSKKPTFSETLMNFIDERGLKDSDVYNKAGISRQLFSKIRIHQNYKPTKPTVLLFALAMELDLDDTQELLASAGFTLSHSSKQDLIIEFLITKGIHDIFTINDVLYEFKEPTLGT